MSSTIIYRSTLLTSPSYMQGVPLVRDADQDATDLMKCIASVIEEEKLSGAKVHRALASWTGAICLD